MLEHFDDQAEFLARHCETVTLGDIETGRLVVSPRLQGRVMTSSVPGLGKPGFGWINRSLIERGATQAHINPFGGEDRLWFGPEGGPFSIFFRPGDEQTFENWQTPAALDSEAFEIVAQTRQEVAMRHRATFANASGMSFEVGIERTVRLLPPSLSGGVSFETVNRVTNVGAKPWRKETGLLSIWVLGMFQAGPGSVAVLPYLEGGGPLANDRYFGKVPSDRLSDVGGALLFRGDGRFRSKIGLAAHRAAGTLGALDTTEGTLTLVGYTRPEAPNGYVDSMWGTQEDPYAGDVVNSYNDDGSLGAFFELETSSPALALAPGESATHVHTTSHAVLDRGALADIVKARLGVGLDRIEEFASP